jgi:hypothetical protein
MKTKSKKPNEVRMPLADIKKLPEWPKIKKVVDEAVAEQKAAYPGSVVELKETKWSLQIWIDGQPELEMDGVDLKATAAENNLN